MRVVRIDRFDDPRIDDYRNLPDAGPLRERNLFVAEGRLVVGRLLVGGQRVVSLLLNQASFRALENSLAGIPDDAPVYVCDASDFATVTGFNLHRGCLALANRPADRTPSDITDGSGLILVLEGVTDADNVGSAFRNAAAFGADGVLLSPSCCDPLYRKAIRTSMGSVLQVRYARIGNWPADLEALKAKGFTLVGLTPKVSAIDLASLAGRQSRRSTASGDPELIQRRPRTAVLVGSEGRGLTAAAEAMADVCVRIPIRPDVDSLNLATATGIALYCLTV